MAVKREYDVVIVGGGVTGTAILYVLSCYTNVRRILFVERRAAVGMVNSSRVNNSQTLHRGPIETNYALQAALKVSAGAEYVEGFIERHAPDICLRIPKMVIGVGEKEAASITERFHTFKPHYPDIRLLDRDMIAEAEPAVMNGRDPKQTIVALQETHGYAVDYQRLAECFLAEARRGTAQIDFVFHDQVKTIEKATGGHEVTIGADTYHGKAVIVAAGSPSLVFAHRLGYGREFGMLPVTADFFRTRSLNGQLRGKVYTKQIEKIPFAAPHGDPAVYDPNETRFGPTAKPIPLLERGNYGSFIEFLRTSTVSPRGLYAALKIASDPEVGRFLLKNQAYGLPYFGKRIFLRDVRKICPSLTADDITLDAGAGGVRGQLIDLTTGTIAKGKDKIVGDGIVFIMAPSPGASFCLGNALEDAIRLVLENFLGSSYRFDQERFERELGRGIRVENATVS